MLKRTLIRQAVVQILLDPATALTSGSCETGLTAALDRVYDSPSDPWQVAADLGVPTLIAVYTGDETGDQGNSDSGDQSAHVEMELAIEMYAAGQTDFATEALLDELEEQVRRKVFFDDRFYNLRIVDETGRQVAHEPLVHSIRGYQSRRTFSSAGERRAGVRMLAITVRYVENCLPPEIITGACLAPPTLHCMKSAVIVGTQAVPFGMHYADVPVGISVST
ncbi:hypothetical protein [Paraburkholderia tuberum]|uniref:Uncharacterized protein n=1 Tax=Paraburkholderia tuberum TaxID=157910 RepID=A0A1H1JSH4_9BURK|nr:hypothetical protein [Paraburkholderia tuberum]SDR52898.1 hypothetical protein SAMN05445850_5568 [Paraburkholderia tuberum]